MTNKRSQKNHVAGQLELVVPHSLHNLENRLRKQLPNFSVSNSRDHILAQLNLMEKLNMMLARRIKRICDSNM